MSEPWNDYENVEPGPWADYNKSWSGAGGSWADNEDSWSEVMGKSVMQGLTFLPTSIGALNRWTDDLLGMPPKPDGSRDLYDISKEAAQFWTPKTETPAKKYASDMTRTMAEMGSTLLLTGGAALPTLSIGAGAQKYMQAREEDSGILPATGAGITQAGIEYVTEKIPVGILLKPGLKFGKRLALGMLTDLPGELLATAGEMAIVDTQILGKTYTMSEYFSALKDTAIVSIGVTGGITTVSHPFIKKIDEFKAEVDKNPEIYQDALDGVVTHPEKLKDINAVIDEIRQKDKELETVEVKEPAESVIPEQIPDMPEIDIALDEMIEAEEVMPTELQGELLEPEIDKASNERIISDETYRQSQAVITEKLIGMKAGVDPSLIPHYVVIGAYHIESGIRKFGAWSKVMVEKFGEDIKPYLKELWKHSNEYLSGKMPEGDVVKQIREITNQTKGTPVITEKSALQATMKKAEQVSKQAFRAGFVSGKEEVSKPKIETLKQRIRRITGQTHDIVSISEDVALSAAFTKAQRAARDAYRVGNKDGVLKERERMRDILLWKEYRDFRKKEIKQDIKGLKKIKEKSKGKIAVDYQNKLSELLEGIDLTTPSEATIERLQGLQAFIEREGIPLGISRGDLAQLDRLSKVPFRDLSIDAQKTLLDFANKIYQLGVLKQGLTENKKARELAKEHAELIQSTVNLDPTLSGEMKPTKTDTFVMGLKRVDAETLHTFRMADKADGNQDYNGKNVSMIKNEINKEIKIKNTLHGIMKSIHSGIQAIGLKDITEDQLKRINVVLMSEQEARSQVQAMLGSYGMAEIPELTPKERLLMELLRQTVGMQTEQVAKVYETREVLPFPKVENYWPIRYDNDFFAPFESIDQMRSRNRTKSVEQGFTKKRVPGVELVPRHDLLSILEESLYNQFWYIHMQPLLDDHYSLVRTPEYKAAAGELLWNWWKDQIDIVARKGWSASARPNPILRTFRLNLNQAVLGYRLSSIVMQPFAVFDAMSYSMSHWGPRATVDVLSEFTKAWLNPKGALQFAEESEALRLRKAGEIAIEETLAAAHDVKGYELAVLSKVLDEKGIKRYSQFKKWAIELSMKGIRTSDIITAAGVEKGLLKILKRHGISNAKQEADFLMNVVSGSSEITIRPHILARGEGMRTWFTFQSFFLNRWGLISHDIIRTGFTKDNKRKLMAAFAMMILFAAGLAEDEAREIISEWTTGKDSKMNDEAFLTKVLLYLPRQVPIAGGLFEKWASAEPPVLRVGEKIGTGTRQVAEGKWGKGMEKMLEGIMTLLLGIPGTSQMFDLYEGRKPKDNEGEVE